MPTTLGAKLAALPPDRRARIESRAAEIIEEEMTLAQLRSAMRRTQADMAERLRMKQASVSRLERRNDMLLSTLRSYVRAAGGELDLVARFPEGRAVRIRSLADLDETGA
jgi:transcriptional regulator with XRE-family HTH domain